MSILDELTQTEVWQEFYQYKTSRNQLTQIEQKELEVFLCEKRYLKGIQPEIPEKKLISKMGSTKKRVVYRFGTDMMWKLKLMAYLLYRYDDKLTESCYSFRRHVTAKTAFDRIVKIENVDKKYVVKADIHNYFNSIPVDALMEVISQIIDDDPALLSFLNELMCLDKSVMNGEIIEEKRGAMAGIPLASFFANFYLLDMDEYFAQKGIDYFRYSDDILLFADTEAQARELYDELESFIMRKGLEMNPDKVKFYTPVDGFEFLGFQYKNGDIDLSQVTIEKMKGKIRRKARALYRKKDQKQYSYEKVAKMMIRSFDNAFYDLTGNHEFTWTRFYFPVITSSEGLKKIDACMVQYLRYLYRGRHYKGNYAIEYEQLKRLGYTSLVHEYYTWKKENVELLKMND